MKIYVEKKFECAIAKQVLFTLMEFVIQEIKKR